MKNKKGFTLIELIATVGIMALIGIVIAANMTGLFSKRQDEDYEAFLKEMEDAACMYVETAEFSSQRSGCKSNASGCPIAIQKLIEKGYIKEELKDPNTGDLAKNKYQVIVKWVDGVKTCKSKAIGES